MGVLLGLVAAVTYGVSDFLGGVASRRVHFLWVSLGGAVVNTTLAAAVLAVPTMHRAAPGALVPALLWGALGGVGGAVGILLLYRGYAEGEITVVGPLSAVGAAALPALVGALLGDRLTAVAWLGVLLALPSIWLMARPSGPPDDAAGRPDPAGPEAPRASQPRRPRPPRRLGTGVADGLVSGAGFALLFIGLGRAGDRAGLWPVLADQATSLLLLTAAVLVGAFGRPRHPRPDRRSVLLVVGAGLLGVTATVGYFLAVHRGSLTVAAVLTSLYPGFTVLLAVLVLRERPGRAQKAGLLLGAVAVVAIALG